MNGHGKPKGRARAPAPAEAPRRPPGPVLGESDFSLTMDGRLALVGCNEPFARWLGHDDPEELRGRLLAETLDPDSRPELAALPRRLVPGIPLTVELNHRTRAGRLAPARYHVFAPGSFHPAQRCTLAFGSDRQRTTELLEEMIDLKREREVQLARTRELNGRLGRQNADLGAISHMINHDVSNSLNAINLTAVLMGHRAAAVPEQVARASADIQGLCRHVAGMMKGFVALADVAHTPLRPEPVDLEEAAREMLELVAANRPEVAHRVSYRFDARHAFADPNHVRQVFENLLSNAFKYRDPSRPALELRLTARPGPGSFVVELADNALGVPADRQATLFDLHTRAHAQVSDGHGVGLAIVKRLVEANGGAIDLASEPGVGSTFRITLPARPFGSDFG